ncbi:MAG: hypothetical protein HY744_17380 [Deltaproteobacteria bacterium]|nr:hypothetical protein [Deltaproteobacteria bacterium]
MKGTSFERPAAMRPRRERLRWGAAAAAAAGVLGLAALFLAAGCGGSAMVDSAGGRGPGGAGGQGGSGAAAGAAPCGSCAAGRTCCDGECVDTQTDAENCGGCAVNCGPNEICSVGQCVLQCLGGTSECSG